MYTAAFLRSLTKVIDENGVSGAMDCISEVCYRKAGQFDAHRNRFGAILWLGKGDRISEIAAKIHDYPVYGIEAE